MSAPVRIGPHHVRVGDTVEVTEETTHGVRSWRFVVASVEDKHGTGPTIAGPPQLIGHLGFHCSLFENVEGYTLSLVSRGDVS